MIRETILLSRVENGETGGLEGKMLGGWRLMLVVQRQPPGSSELPLNDQHPGPQPPSKGLGGASGKSWSPAGPLFSL